MNFEFRIANVELRIWETDGRRVTESDFEFEIRNPKFEMPLSS